MIKLRNVHTLLLSLLILGGTALPLFQHVTGMFTEGELHGVEAVSAPSLPSFTFSSYFAGTFQRNFEQYFNMTLGFRNALVRSDNQLQLWLFDEISSSYGSPIVTGRSHTLFEKLYVDAYNRTDPLDPEPVNRAASALARLAAALRKHEVHLLVLITPSKAETYPELLPPALLNEARRRAYPDPYVILVNALATNGVPFVDGKAIVLAEKARVTAPVFPPSGTHWATFAACEVGAALQQKFVELGRFPLPAVRCTPHTVRDIPEPFDRDLADLANLWDPSPFFVPLPYPPEISPASSARDRVLFIGSSFLWQLFAIFEKNGAYAERTMLYYFKRKFTYPATSPKPISPSQLDWRSLLSVNFVVVEVNESSVQRLGYGFIGAANKALKRLAKRDISLRPPATGEPAGSEGPER